MSDQWYIKTTNGKRGPYSIQHLQRYINAGAILPNAGLGDGEGPWVAAATVDGLHFSEELTAKFRSAKKATKSSIGEAGTTAESTDEDTSQSDARAEAIDEQTRELAARSSELDVRAESLDYRVDELQQGEAALTQRSQDLDQREATLGQNGQELHVQREVLLQREAELQSWHEQLELKRVELESREADVSESSATFGNREKTLAEAEAELAGRQDDYASKVARYEQRESELAALVAEVAQAESLSEVASQENQSREQSLAEHAAELDQRDETLAAREHAIRQSEKAIEEQATLLAERETDIGNRHTEVLNWQREVEAMRSSIEIVDSQKNDAEDSAQQLKKTISELESQLQRVNAQLASQSEQLGAIQDEALAVPVDATARDETPIVDLADGSAEFIVEEKKKLLQEFAARQESLSHREAELMRREEELTRRELDIAVLSDSSPETNQPPTSALQPVESQAEPKQQTPEKVQATEQEREPEPEEEPVSEDDSAETVDSSSQDAPVSSWEEILGRTQEEPAAYELAEHDDPRYAPLNTVENDETDQHFDDVLGSSSDHEHVYSESQESPWEQVDGEVLDVAPHDRLPSEILPSELPEYDGLSAEQVATVEKTVPASALVPAGKAVAGAPVEMSLVDLRRQAYEEQFGPCSRFDEDDDPIIQVDVSVHLPDGTRDFATLVTSGMSDYPIPMPNGQRSVRAELLLYATHVDELAIQILRGAAKVPYRKKHGLSIGTTGSLDEMQELLSGSNQQDCVYMLPVIESDSKPIPAKEVIGSVIQLFWLITITDAERKLIESGGIHKFLALLEKNNHAVYFDLTRECYVKRKGWFRR